MLGFDIGFNAEATKIFLRRNGSAGPMKEVRLAPGSKLADLLEKAGKALDLDAPRRIFFSNGVECTDVDHIVDDEVLQISCGEPFKACEGAEAGLQRAGNFILQGKLGQGGFGTVVKGVHSETGEFAAVKFVSKRSFRQLSDLQRVFQEIQALRQLNHPNVIRIIDVVEHPDSICFIMEYAAGGELRHYVEQRGSLSEEEARVFFKQIVRAIYYVHSKKIIHRDLKLENILLDKENRCKIVDFGLSDYVSSKERTVTDAGTEAYLAPEVLTGHSAESDPYKIDVWSLGVILYALHHGRLPFHRADADTCAMLEGDGPRFNEECSERYKRLVVAMLTPIPARRVAVDDITVNAWVTGRKFAHASTAFLAVEREEGKASGSRETLDSLPILVKDGTASAPPNSVTAEGSVASSKQAKGRSWSTRRPWFASTADSANTKKQHKDAPQSPNAKDRRRAGSEPRPRRGLDR